MASRGGDADDSSDLDDDVNCGVTEDRNKVVLMYDAYDCTQFSWEWIHTESGHRARYTATGGKSGGHKHESKPIPDEIYNKLSTPTFKGKVDKFYKVVMNRRDEVSIEEYF